MSIMPREIRYVSQTRNVLVDGVPLNFYLAEKPRVEVDFETGVHTVTFVVLCDDFVVEHPLSEAANRAIDDSLNRRPLEAS